MIGSYLTYIEFDKVRYWDIRENKYVNSYDLPNQLKSSSLLRDDRVKLAQTKLAEAQAAKEKLENLQRHDRKLRENYHKHHKK